MYLSENERMGLRNHFVDTEGIAQPRALLNGYACLVGFLNKMVRAGSAEMKKMIDLWMIFEAS